MREALSNCSTCFLLFFLRGKNTNKYRRQILAGGMLPFSRSGGRLLGGIVFHAGIVYFSAEPDPAVLSLKSRIFKHAKNQTLKVDKPRSGNV